MMPGEIIDGRYQIVRQLGRGFLGALFEARHLGTSRRVALKVLTSDELARDARLVDRFEREARAAGAIDSQYIAQVLDAGRDPATGRPYMVSEFLIGESAEQLFRRLGRLTPDLALRMMAQLAIGVQKVHEARIIHRDIQPAKVFFARGDADEVTVKLLDFGLAKVKTDAEAAQLASTGTLAGSPLYMSPERARGSHAIDFRSDVWSMGILFYRALTGRAPHQHLLSITDLLMAICMQPPPPVRQQAPWVAPELAAIVDRALRLHPDERFPSAAAMLLAIKPLLPGGLKIREPMLVPGGPGAPPPPPATRR